MDNENEEKEYTCRYVYEKGEWAGEICGENTRSNPYFCWQHKTKNVKKLLVVDTKVAVEALKRQRKIIQQELKRLKEAAAEVESKLAANDPSLPDVQKIKDLELK